MLGNAAKTRRTFLKRIASPYARRVNAVIGEARQSPARTDIKVATALMGLRAFYGYLLVVAFPKFGRASEAWTNGRVPDPRLHLDITSLFPTEHWPLVALLATGAMLVSSILLVAAPTLAAPRVAVALGFVLCTAIDFEQTGKINHGNHIAMWVAIGACFLPSSRGFRESPKDFLRSFFGLQLLVGTLYTCAGLCKVLGVFYDWSEGTTWFGAEALPLTIAGNWARSSTTLLGGFLVQSPQIARLAQVGALSLELFALPAFCIARLQRYWALGLVCMHTLILASMRIHFHQSCIMLLLFLVASPFVPALKRGETAADPSGAPAGELKLPSVLALAWAPLLIVVYVSTAFSRFDFSKGEFQQELYPVSAMPMFFRVHSDEQHVRQLAKVRRHLDRHGLFPKDPRRQRPRKNSSSQR